MIQAVMLIALGFLTASFIGIMVAPSLWSRAYRLSRKRLEKSLPLSLAEIEASRDGLRADYAVKLRRLETALASARQKAALQLVDGSRLQMQIVTLREHIADLDLKLAERSNAATVFEQAVTRRIPELEREIQALKGELAGRTAEVADYTNRLNRKDESLEAARKSALSFEDELNRLRLTLEKGSAERGGRRLQRPSQWTIDDYRSEYDRLNLDLSKMRQQLAQLQEKDAQASSLLKGELQKLAELILVSAQTRPPTLTPPDRIDLPGVRRRLSNEVRRERPQPWPQTLTTSNDSEPVREEATPQVRDLRPPGSASSVTPIPNPQTGGTVFALPDDGAVVPVPRLASTRSSGPAAPGPVKRSRILKEVTAKPGPEAIEGPNELSSLGGGDRTGSSRLEARIAVAPDIPTANELSSGIASPFPAPTAIGKVPTPSASALKADSETGLGPDWEHPEGGASQAAFAGARKLEALSELLVMSSAAKSVTANGTTDTGANEAPPVDGQAGTPVPLDADLDATHPRTLLDRLRVIGGEPPGSSD